MMATTASQRFNRKTHSNMNPTSRSWTTVETAAPSSCRPRFRLSSTEIPLLIRISSAARPTWMYESSRAGGLMLKLPLETAGSHAPRALGDAMRLVSIVGHPDEGPPSDPLGVPAAEQRLDSPGDLPVE